VAKAISTAQILFLNINKKLKCKKASSLSHHPCQSSLRRRRCFAFDFC
jgi:hypothetical protein